jgi:NAD(P)-dependent dehydrogenase (short-subunit alcohol dehydrogenase family)
MGMNVVINYGSSAGAAESTAAKACSFGVKAITVKVNVAVRTDLHQLFESAIMEFGPIELVMSNFGIEHFGSVDTTTEEGIDKTFAVNIKAQYFVAQEAYKYLADNGRLIFDIFNINAEGMSQKSWTDGNYRVSLGA